MLILMMSKANKSFSTVRHSFPLRIRTLMLVPPTYSHLNARSPLRTRISTFVPLRTRNQRSLSAMNSSLVILYVVPRGGERSEPPRSAPQADGGSFHPKPTSPYPYVVYTSTLIPLRTRHQLSLREMSSSLVILYVAPRGGSLRSPPRSSD
jgi:hypothetical protein